MQSYWFREPLNKWIKYLAYLSVICGILVAVFQPVKSSWNLSLGLLVPGLFYLVYASFTIVSGVYSPVICKGPPQIRNIAITFDDGPGEKTGLILDLLQKYKAKASFFIIGNAALKNPDKIKRIARQHHTIGNHTYNHKPWFPVMPVKNIRNEIIDTQNVLYEITGLTPMYFRPPYGVTNPLIEKALRAFQFETIGWSVRSLDTVNTNADKIYKRIIKRLEPGSIVLLHDTSACVLQVLERLLLFCTEHNLKAVNLDELFENPKTDEKL